MGCSNAGYVNGKDFSGIPAGKHPCDKADR